MKARTLLGLTWLALGVTVSPLPAADTNVSKLCVIRVDEEITHNTLYLFRRGLREADSIGAGAVVVDMNTNGGRVDATEEIIRLLERAPMKTFTYVDAKAYSAGAFIAAATDRIYMAPGSVIGAATPVLLIPGEGVQELPASYQEKISSAMRALIRATAQQKGHNPDVFEAMVDADKEVILDGETISPEGKLLTLTNEEAARSYGEPPQPLLSAGTMKSLDALLEKEGLAGAEVVTVEPYGFEIVGRWLTTIAPLLILVGFVAIYIELKTPGIGVAALVAAVAFGLYFFGNYAAGLAGWEELVLFLAGILLLLVEVFVIPGFGVIGVSGIILIFISLVLAMTQRWPGGPTIPALPDLRVPFITVAFSFLGSVIVMMILARYLPKTSLFRRLELQTAVSAAEGYISSKAEARDLLGAVGVADTLLRPAGKGRFGDRLVDVVTEGDLIEKGQAIKIVEVQGSRVVVTRAT